MVSVIMHLWASPKWGDLFLFETKAYDPVGKRKFVREVLTLGFFSPKAKFDEKSAITLTDSLLSEILKTVFENYTVSNPRSSDIINITYLKII